MPATLEQKAKAAAKRARFKVIVKQVGDMSEDERAVLAKRMSVVTTEGHALSVHNACLVAMQCPGATIVGGFRQWLKQGRCVAAGQHGLMIWVPIGRKKSADSESGDDAATAKPGFIPGNVFDISQTVLIGGQD